MLTSEQLASIEDGCMQISLDVQRGANSVGPLSQDLFIRRAAAEAHVLASRLDEMVKLLASEGGRRPK